MKIHSVAVVADAGLVSQFAYMNKHKMKNFVVYEVFSLLEFLERGESVTSRLLSL